MALGISPLVDFAFKLILGSPEHAAVTIHFLNAILAGQPKITRVHILNPFLGKESELAKLSVLDILATDEHGRKLNIEIQTSLPMGMSQRLTYYASRLYVEQLTEGASYVELRPAITICVLTKSMFPQIPQLHLDFRLRENSGQLLNDDLQIHLLELPKLHVTAENVSSATPIEQWAFFLLNADKLTPEEIERLFPNSPLIEAAGVLKMIARTPEQQQFYDARLKFQLDEAARLEMARFEGRTEGRTEGRAEGEEKGRVKGELLGRVRLLLELLEIASPTAMELETYGQGQLAELADQLQSQLRSRGR